MVPYSGLLRVWVLTLLCRSWRKQFIGLEQLDARLQGKEKLILVFWHGKYFALLPLLRNRKACVFTSLSARGDIIKDLLQRFGYQGVQLRDHAGQKSVQTMRSVLQSCHAAAIAVDGPLGPQHHVHHGAIQLASECGHSLVPATVAAWPCRVLSSRWDHYEIPPPFSRVCLIIGEPLSVPPQLTQQQISQWQARIKQVLEQLGDRAEACVRSR